MHCDGCVGLSEVRVGTATVTVALFTLCTWLALSSCLAAVSLGVFGGLGGCWEMRDTVRRLPAIVSVCRMLRVSFLSFGISTVIDVSD